MTDSITAARVKRAIETRFSVEALRREREADIQLHAAELRRRLKARNPERSALIEVEVERFIAQCRDVEYRYEGF